MPYHHTSQTFLSSRDAVEIFWQKWMPEETERIIVFQHGIGEHANRYQNLLHTFEGTNTAFYALDLRGHGRTGGRRGHVDHFHLYVDDLADLIRIALEEHEHQKVFLLGQSLGGAIAAKYAIPKKHQEYLKGLILMSPAIEVPLFFSNRIKKVMASILVKFSPSTTLDTHIDPRFFSHDPKVVQAYKNDPLVHQRISFALGHEFFILSKDLFTQVQAIGIPVYIVHGTADSITSPEGSKKLYHLLRTPDKTIRLYDDLYHETMNERDPDKQRVLNDLKTWILAH